MHPSALLTSALAVGALALPQGQLEKRQQVTARETVTVTVTVFANPYATPAWTPPRFSQTPNAFRPPNAPPLWTPPRIDDPKTRSRTVPAASPVRTSSSTTSTPRPVVSSTPRPVVSSTPRPVVSSTPRPVVSSTPIRASSSSRTTSAYTPPVGSPVSNRPSSTPSPVRTTSSTIVGVPISNTPATTTTAVRPTSSPINTPVGSVGPSHISGPAQATLSAGTDYQNAILYHHNAARANHGAQPLVWDDTVAQTAAQAADTCNFAHYIPAGAGQGQNLFTISGSFFNVTAGITESWYKGEFQAMVPYFGAASIPDDVFHNVGHLTQVLWKGTTRVGCVSIDCGTRMIVGGVSGSPLNKYTVCNYAPAGNVAGQYAINVGLPIDSTNLGSWAD